MSSELHQAWSLLQKSNKNVDIAQICANQTRASTFSMRAGPIYLNFARQAVDEAGMSALRGLCDAGRLQQAIGALFGGEPINRSENRPVLHTALRAAAGSEPKAEVSAARECREQMVALVNAVHSGKRQGHTGRQFDQVLSIGIGGSDLGPRLACDALGTPRMPVRYLSNIDGDAVDAVTRELSAETTLVVVISKSFGTQETLTNALSVRRWLTESMGCTDQEAGAHMVAVTARPDRAAEMGIDQEAILPMWDWVGGRYSLWSAVGLPVALAVGYDAFESMLQGAQEIDEHFRSAPVSLNLPITMALLCLWNHNVLGHATQAVVPYSDRLARLPAYLQQLLMESNGKNATRTGEPVDLDTSPIIWGGAGTDAQHAFFQMLHQGTTSVPVDFVGFRVADHEYPEHHHLLLSNMLAQSEALALGRSRAATQENLQAAGQSKEAALEASRHRVYPGNRPSSVFILDDLSARSFGALLAAWEHSVFVQGWLLGINSFDQWGVQLGKVLADRISPLLANEAAAADSDVDPVTQALIAELKSHKP